MSFLAYAAQTPQLLAACEQGDLALVENLLASGMPVDAADESGRTGLMSASSRNRVEVVRALIELGADVNAQNRNGTTPLMFAKTATFAYGDVTCMQLLIEAGAVIDKTDNRGLTALDYTIQRFNLISSVLVR